MQERINKSFNINLDENSRKESYDYIENFIEVNVPSWETPPDTDAMVNLFNTEIKAMSDGEFAFMLCHTGYIPEFYGHDSSQETLYSKLVEVMVCEWALRVGFESSFIQTQKASKEDVTIVKDEKVIVSDAKSFRLGRSQGAPNVKDVIKKADYKKWLESYDEDKRTGGLLPFPSLHIWKKGSDAITYCSDSDEPIMIIFYEHLAFMMIHNIGADRIIDILEDYGSVHNQPVKEVKTYFERLIPTLFNGKISEWKSFSEEFDFIIRERVQHTIHRISEKLDYTKKGIQKSAEEIEDLKVLRANLIEAEYHIASEQLLKNLVNIRKHRSH